MCPIRVFLEKRDIKILEYQQCLDQIGAIQKLGSDDYAHELPNKIAIENSRKALKILASKHHYPTQICPSPDGGIMFEFVINPSAGSGHHNFYYLLEFYNDEDIVYLKSNNQGAIESLDLTMSQVAEVIDTYLGK